MHKTDQRADSRVEANAPSRLLPIPDDDARLHGECPDSHTVFIIKTSPTALAQAPQNSPDLLTEDTVSGASLSDSSSAGSTWRIL